MVQYNLSHLTQDTGQIVKGPIQDDEALFLYSIIRTSRLNRILEIGGLSGYSAKNFLEALKYNSDNSNILYTCDINPVPILASNHKVIIKNALHLTPQDLDNLPIDMIFFDCHDFVQLQIYKHLVKKNIITDNTILALHDTNLHYAPYDMQGPYIEEDEGYAHQPVERSMTNTFKSLGYDILNLHTDKTKHSPEFPFRHGITVCKKFKYLN
jgi:predicted O-methyltransferase YrrM